MVGLERKIGFCFRSEALVLSESPFAALFLTSLAFLRTSVKMREVACELLFRAVEKSGCGLLWIHFSQD